MSKRILVIGANGQLGSELTAALAGRHGSDRVVAADLAAQAVPADVPYERLDVMDRAALEEVVKRLDVGQIYHLAAMLSAAGEQHPRQAWDLNMGGLLNVLDVASRSGARIFWPSSIAVFGATTPAVNTPQRTILEPSTIYGISKLAGEGWCRWYHARHGVDVRSLRYPGLVSWRTPPGGGTTDYAIDFFHAAVAGRPSTCFLQHDERLPMMAMDDAVRATLELMQASPDAISERGSYNLAGISFSPAELADEIRHSCPGLEIRYDPDHRQRIAASWPDSIDDSLARRDWGWQPRHDLAGLVNEMLAGVRRQTNCGVRHAAA